MIEIKINPQTLRNTENLLIRLENNSKRPTNVAMKKIGLQMVSSIDKNFEMGGRPVKWNSLSPMTLAMRRNKKSAKILQDTGFLRGSINYEIINDGTALAIGTPAKYGRIHQFGGNIRIPARIIVPKKAKALRFMIGGKTVFAKKVSQKSRMVTIPQRKFLMFQDEDISSISEIMAEDLLGEK